MKRQALVSVLIGAALLGGAGLVTWMNLSGTPAPAAAVAVGPQSSRTQAHPVTTRKASRGDLETFVKLACEVEAESEVSVFPDVSGRVDQIQIGIGSAVTPDTVLATIDPSRPGTRYEASPVRSPIAGTVVDVVVKRGQSVTPTTPAVIVATVNSLVLTAELPERYASYVGRNSVAAVTLDALGEPFTAPVRSVPPVIDPVSRSKEITFSVPDAVSGVEPGMFGSIRLTARRSEGAIIVPFEAIVQEGDKNFVFVVRGGSAAKREIELGLLSADLVEIRRGIEEGEDVITTGQSFLKEGSPVVVVGN